MKFIKIIFLIVIVVGISFFVVGMFLPKTYSVSRSTIIKAPDSLVFKNVADFNNFLKWNPWTKMEPAAKVEISGTPLQAGHLWEWKGKETGEGQMELDKIQAPKSVDFVLTFTKPFQSVAQTNFTFEPVAEGTKVTWRMNGESNSTVEKWMYLNMDNMLGKDFESGLKNLKELSEKN